VIWDFIAGFLFGISIGVIIVLYPLTQTIAESLISFIKKQNKKKEVEK